MKKRVLITDDDGSIRESLKRLLEENGYDVMVAEDGERALALTEAERVDLMLLDLEMPRRDGWDVLESLSERKPVMPVVVITGLADQMDTRTIPGLGMLLEKPVEVPALLNAIEKLLAASPETKGDPSDWRGNQQARSQAESPGYLAMPRAGDPSWPKR
jgi:DNA-binding response OmpR family regulator